MTDPPDGRNSVTDAPGIGLPESLTTRTDRGELPAALTYPAPLEIVSVRSVDAAARAGADDTIRIAGTDQSPAPTTVRRDRGEGGEEGKDSETESMVCDTGMLQVIGIEWSREWDILMPAC